jgi:Trk K+ transport system NAD-binding subunit
MNDQIIWIVLKRLRTPFLVLIVTFGISILGLVLIPGVDDAGHKYQMTFFDAFYFVTYTASTIGFGDNPYTFTYPQRIWVSWTIYFTVIGWFYGIGSIVSLIQDEALKKAMNRNRFRKQVSSLKEPFYIMLGYNSIIKSIINRLNNGEHRVVVLDRNESKIDELIFENFYPHVPAFVGEATNQQTLKMAGIHQKNCLGVISLFEDDTKNSQIATICKLLNKHIDIIVKTSSPQHFEYFKSMGLHHIQDPFEIISQRISLSITAPHVWLLEMWIYGHSLNIRNRDRLPTGRYIICGYGRMGKAIEHGLIRAGIEYELYDISAKEYKKVKETTIFGDEEDTQKLIDLGVNNSACIIAATKDDLLNLTILNKAKLLNPNIFTMARENSLEDLNIFQAAKINKIYILEKILADSTYNYLAHPLSELFIQGVRNKDEEWAKIIVKMLNNMTGKNPDNFELTINEESAYALTLELNQSAKITLSNLRHSRENRNEILHIAYLLLKRGKEIYLMPDSEMEIKIDDQLLIVADDENREDFEYIINNIYELNYVLAKK